MSAESLLGKVGPHEKALRRFFREFDLPAEVQPWKKRAVILVFSNRSGSSLIGEHLRATGRFSGFGEPFNQDTVIQRCQEEGLDSFYQYLQWMVDKLHVPTTQFGMKASLDQVLMLMRSGAVARFFPHVRWLLVERVDLLSQAVSLHIAEQTAVWHSFQEDTGKKPAYNYKRIRELLLGISDNYAASASLLSLCGVTPYHITYEQFVADPEAETTKIAQAMGAGENIRIKRKRLQLRKQANEINEEFRLQFLRDFLKRGI
ncbi:MAG: hypothetical protein CME59_17955 [Halioglobus sp.]|nr:hypothetical protein [Halioglobus sp.]|tara:strand:+ start:222 stop:1001 length:780 start_codon:yes stop_codon:yes gene_type:complete